MQIGQLSFKLAERVIGPSNIARAAGAHTKTACSFHKRADHLRMLSHSKIIVRAPDNDFTPAFRRMVDGVWKAAGNALEVGEHSVAPFFLQLTQCSGEIAVVIHLSPSNGGKVHDILPNMRAATFSTPQKKDRRWDAASPFVHAKTKLEGGPSSATTRGLGGEVRATMGRALTWLS